MAVRQRIVDEIHPPSFVGARCRWHPTLMQVHDVLRFAHLSIRCSERHAEVGIEAFVGSVGDSHRNALAETIVGRCKAEVIHARGPRCGGAREARAGSVVQSPSPARTDQQRASGCIRAVVLSANESQAIRPDSATGVSGISGAVHRSELLQPLLAARTMLIYAVGSVQPQKVAASVLERTPISSGFRWRPQCGHLVAEWPANGLVPQMEARRAGRKGRGRSAGG